MEKGFEKKYHALEDKHWWSCTRRELILTLMPVKNYDIKILDLGCSSGALIRLLHEKNFASVYGIDISKESMKACRKSKLKGILLGNATRLPVKNNSFDLIIASDILEHIENDYGTLNEWKRILKSGGHLIIFAPAFRFLWSSHDIINRHFRRYEKTSLKKLISKNDFKIIRLGYWNFLLFLPYTVINFLKSKNKKEDRLVALNPILNGILIKMLSFENFLIKKGVNFPFGISLFVVLEKN